MSQTETTLSDAETRARHTAPAARGFLGIVRDWNLSEAQQLVLLGASISRTTLQVWKSDGPKTTLTIDQLTRISLLLGIDEGLPHVFRRAPQEAERRLRRPRGTYCATAPQETAISETTYHDARMLTGAGAVVLEKALIEANLAGTLVNVRSGRPAPAGLYDPSDYSAGQSFGAVIRNGAGDGMLYDSVRHRHAGGDPLGECAAVFRPPVLRDTRMTRTVEYDWDGAQITQVR